MFLIIKYMCCDIICHSFVKTISLIFPLSVLPLVL